MSRFGTVRSVVASLTVLAALLLYIPSVANPFSTPKSWVLIVSFVLTMPLAALDKPKVNWISAVAILQVLWFAIGYTFDEVRSLSSLLIQFGFTGLLFFWTAFPLRTDWVSKALAIGGSVVGSVAILQLIGLDPIGATANGARLHLYGTLGNPDFVAAVLVPTLAITTATALRDDRRWFFASALQLTALYALQSFATLLALAAALVVTLARTRKPQPSTLNPQRIETRTRSPVILFAAGVVLISLAVPLSRSPLRSLSGRAYLHSVVAPHLLDAPLTGLGPGGVEAFWPVWEVELWTRRCGDDAACVAAHPDRAFAALNDHVHDDYAERLIEQGLPGLLFLLALFAEIFRTCWRNQGAHVTAALAGIASLAARACVDFPLARPAELCVLAALAAIAAQPSRGAHAP